jgi:hypothetical protein
MNLSPVLFWDTDAARLDEEKHARYIIARVVMYGTLEDWQEIKKRYGLEGIKTEMLKEKELDPRSLSFISKITDTPIQQFACYTHRRSVPPHSIF